MRIRIFHITIALFGVWNILIAQQYTQYTTRDGLPSNLVYKTAQDSKGFLWMATDKGLVKYNGKDFKVFDTGYGLPINDIWELCITPDDKIWYFSKSEQLGYIQNDSVHSFRALGEDPILVPREIYKQNNSVIIGSGRNLYYLNSNEEWEPVARREDDEGWGRWSRLEAVPESISPHLDAILSAKAIQKEVVWPRTREKSSFFHVSNRDSLFLWYNDREVAVYREGSEPVLVDLEENLKVEDPRVIRFHPSIDGIQVSGERFWAYFHEEDGFPKIIRFPDHIVANSAFMDRTGNVWIATRNQGVYKLPQVKQSISYSFQGKRINSFESVKGDVVASVQGDGFYSYVSEFMFEFPSWQTEDFIFTAAGIDSLDRGYYITNTEIGIRDGQTINKRSQVTGIVRDLVYWKGHLYGFRSAGLSKLDPRDLNELDVYPHEAIMSFLPFKDRLLLGTSNGLKALVNDVIVAMEGAPEFKHPILGIHSVSEDLVLVETDGFGAYFTDLNTVNRLKGSEYLSVQDAFVDKGIIWLATHKGVWRYVQDEYGEYKLDRIWDESDGLLSKNVNCVWVEGSNLMVGTDQGMSIHNVHANAVPQLLQIYVNEASFNNELVEASNTEVRFTSNNNMSFSVSTIDYSENTGPMTYSYILEPVQTEWTETRSEIVNFSELSPEDYVLKIQSGGIENSYAFTVLPLWWQRPLVQVAFVLTGLLLTTLLLRRQRKREVSRKTAKLEMQKKLTEFELYALRSQMNPHFVFNSLGAIQYYINNNDFQTSETYLVKFSRLIRQFFELSKEKEIALSEEIKLLTNYLDIEKLRFREKLSYRLKLPDDMDASRIRIPSMLLQPIVENAVNHGIFNKEDGGNLDISFTDLGTSGVQVDIEDDGVGFANTRAKQNGKRNSSGVLQDRLYYLNQSGRWDISYTTREVYPERKDRGNRSTFVIKKRA